VTNIKNRAWRKYFSAIA